MNELQPCISQLGCLRAGENQMGRSRATKPYAAKEPEEVAMSHVRYTDLGPVSSTSWRVYIADVQHPLA